MIFIKFPATHQISLQTVVISWQNRVLHIICGLTLDCLFFSLCASSTTNTAQSMDCSVVISMDTSSYDVNSTWNFTGWSFYKTQHIILDFLHIKGTYELIS